MVYILNLDTNAVNFITAKNKVVNESLGTKTIPTIEFQAISYGVELLQELCAELPDNKITVPINVVELKLLTDSMVCLHWLQSYIVKFDKMQKRSVFVMNRLRTIHDLCIKMPVQFSFIEGSDNPADYISRPVSYKQFASTNYYTGPSSLTELKSEPEHSDVFIVNVPNTMSKIVDEVPHMPVIAEHTEMNASTIDSSALGLVINLSKYSSFRRAASVLKFVYLFINKLKCRVTMRKTRVKSDSDSAINLYREACYEIISAEQQSSYPDIFHYFRKASKTISDIPELVSKLNLILDGDIFRVKSKLPLSKETKLYPILLPKGNLTTMIVRDLHEKLCHAGVYCVLKEHRNEFYLLHYYSTFRKVLRNCVTCRRYNERSITQSKFLPRLSH